MSPNNTTKPGLFITIEGIEGVGKSTCLTLICDFLAEKAIRYKATREPGGTEIAEAIRQVLLASYQEKMTDDTELLLMFAARAQHLAKVIKPALAAGHWVISDRFTDASYAYQGGGRGIEAERIALLEQWVQADLKPDRVLLFDAPVDIALQRAKSRSAPDRIEAEKQAFFVKVRDCYLQRAKQFAHRYTIIDTSQSLAQVKQQLLKILQTMIDG